MIACTHEWTWRNSLRYMCSDSFFYTCDISVPLLMYVYVRYMRVYVCICEILVCICMYMWDLGVPMKRYSCVPISGQRLDEIYVPWLACDLCTVTHLCPWLIYVRDSFMCETWVYPWNDTRVWAWKDVTRWDICAVTRLGTCDVTRGCTRVSYHGIYVYMYIDV